jgi:MFS family permease
MQPNLGVWSAVVAVFLTGFAAGVEYDLLAFMIARYFGVRSYSTIYGFVYGAYVLGSGIGPAVFGAVFDKYQSYDSALILASIMLVVGAFLLVLMGRYSYPKATAVVKYTNE